MLIIATTPMSCCSSTALQNCRSAAQQPCSQTCACPLQHCCCQWQGGNSLAHHCNYNYELLQFYSPAELQKCSTATMPRNLCIPLQHCCCQWQGGNSLACHCNYTYEFMQFIQPYSHAEVQHSNLVQKPVHTLCSTAAVSGKVATALLIIATTPMSRCSSTALQNCRSAAQQPWSQTCACPLQHCCCQWQGGNSLAHHCNYTYESLQFYSPAELQKCSTATMLTNLCMPFAALLLSVARWQQPCSSLQLQL